MKLETNLRRRRMSMHEFEENEVDEKSQCGSKLMNVNALVYTMYSGRDSAEVEVSQILYSRRAMKLWKWRHALEWTLGGHIAKEVLKV